MNKDELQKYVQQIADIRRLSSPQLSDVQGAGEYSKLLRENFWKIGIIADNNRRILEEIVFPMVHSEQELSEQEVMDISEISDMLVNAADLENLDISIMSLLSDKLMRDAIKKQDWDYIVRQLDSQISACYSLTLMTSRIFSNPSISNFFRKKGADAWKELKAYLVPEKFERLSAESKEFALHGARFRTVLHESSSGLSRETALQWLDELDEVMEICESQYYHEAYPEFDWKYFRYRTLENHGSVMDNLYGGELEEEELQRIVRRLKEQELLWLSEPDTYKEFAPLEFVRIMVTKGRYLTKEISREEYRRILLEIYRNRNRFSYNYDNVYINLRIPLNYLLSVDPNHMTEEEIDALYMFYHETCNYVFRMPNSGTLTAIQDFFTVLIRHFIEIPGGITFQDMCLNSMAAFHPPTYVHSMTVARLSRCICTHLLGYRPELFVGVCGAESVEEVLKEKDKILNFAYQAAICHDFGKIPLIDTVFIYGRKLLDFEFDIIKQHPRLGAELLQQYESTREYADIARGHHRWYDNSKGYPEEFDTSKSPYKTIIDIVACADCMDAATDTVGRSYNHGKTVDDFLRELAEGSGTRYAPYLLELFGKEEVKEDIDYLLTSGRQNNYRNTYLVLKKVQEDAEQSAQR